PGFHQYSANQRHLPHRHRHAEYPTRRRHVMLRGASGFGFSGGGIGLKAAGVLAQSAVAASVTGTLTETVLATIAIPAGAMGVNGAIRVTALWSYTNSADTKT